MKMKVQIISSGKFINDLINMSAMIKSMGHTIPREWWHKFIPGDQRSDEGTKFYQRQEPRFICQANIDAVKSADIVVLYVPEKRAYKGSFIEAGVALGQGIPVLCVGELPLSAMFSEFFWVKKYEDVKDFLELWQGQKSK